MKQRGIKQRSMVVLNRVIRYMLHYYKYLFALVIVCILITAVTTAVSYTHLQANSRRKSSLCKNASALGKSAREASSAS